MAIAAEAAARPGKVLTRKAATESPARTAEMAPAKAAAQVSAAAEPAAYMSATTEPATVSTPTSPAARRRVSGQSPGESGSRGQDDHDLT
jgi:hypothetical protein